MTHLHIHSDRDSLLDGIGTYNEYCQLAKEYSHTAIVSTGHGRMGGVVRFIDTCNKHGIKPIVGVEAYLNNLLEEYDENGRRIRGKNNHIILLAKNYEGYQELLKLNYFSFTKGYYYVNRITFDELKKCKNLLIGTACLASEWNRLIVSQDFDRAEDLLSLYKKTFGENFYIEIMLNNIKEQKLVNNTLNIMSKALNIPVVITNDVHYAKKEDGMLQDLVLRMNTKKKIDEQLDISFLENTFYANEDEIRGFNKKYNHNFTDKEITEFLNNSDMIANKVETYSVKTNGKVFIPSQSKNDSELLTNKCKETLTEYVISISEELVEAYWIRLETELEIITGKSTGVDLSSYFLIVSDYLNWAKTNHIVVGAARGSSAGSLVCMLLGITTLDPIEHGLLFERFLNPDRIRSGEFPDIDSDISDIGKKLVEEYVINKYGEDHVCNIITYMQFSVKNTIKDLLRIYNVDFQNSNAFTKIFDDIENKLSLSQQEIFNEGIKKLDDEFPHLKDFYRENKKIIDIVQRFFGRTKQIGKHAGGILISSKPVNELLPIDKISGTIVTAYEESNASDEMMKVGGIKFDILGIKTLRVCQDAINTIKIKYGKEIDLYNVDVHDINLYSEINNPYAIGIFQFSSDGMRNYINKVIPETFNDLVCLNAIYRPGPLELEADNFVKRKNEGLNDVVHPIMQEILYDSHNTILYQEHILNVFHRIGGFTLSESDNVRSLMKKLDHAKDDLTPELRVKWENVLNKFKTNAKELGIKEKDADKIVDKIKSFQKYSFNKSHATAYAYLSVVTLYLSYYYRKEFYAALLSAEEDADKKNEMLYKIKKQKFEVLPPDINTADKVFTTTDKGIIFPLAYIKWLGTSTDDIIKNRPYTDFPNFVIKNSETSRVNKRVVLNLIWAGCFDSIHEKKDRIKLATIYEVYLSKKHLKKWKGNLFSLYETIEKDYSLFVKNEKPLAFENEIREIYNNNKQLSPYDKEKEIYGINIFESFISENIKEKYLNKCREGKMYRSFDEVLEREKPIVCFIQEIVKVKDKNRKDMLFLNLIDIDNKTARVPIFTRDYIELQESNLKLNNGNVIAIYLARRENNLNYKSIKNVKSSLKILL